MLHFVGWLSGSRISDHDYTFYIFKKILPNKKKDARLPPLRKGLPLFEQQVRFRA
jgi:hypothetical protein